MQQGKVLKLQVGSEEISLDEMELAVLASALEESTGMELEMPDELESVTDGAAS
jgi:hypothetical protein